VACTFIFLISIFLCWGIDAYAIIHADIDHLYSAMDGDKNMCGVSAGFENYPYLYITNFDEEDKSNIFKKAVCVDKCPMEVNEEI
jgi:hypothetical protein